MIKLRFLFVSLLLFTFTVSAFSSSNGMEGDDATVVISGTEAVPIDVPRPIFPERALRRNIEGWVVAGYVVNPDGNTSDITIVDSSIEGYFEQAAIEAAKKLKYEPATWNGMPVAQARNTRMYLFENYRANVQPSRVFSKQYEEATTALGNGDLEATRQIIEMLDREGTRKLYDVFLLDLIKGNFYRAEQDYSLAFDHYKRALNLSAEVDEDVRADLYRLTIGLAAYLNRYGEALEYFDRLQDLNLDMPPEDPAFKTVQKIRQVVAGDQPLQATGIIEQPCKTCETLVPYWSHTLMRDEFSIDQVEGEIQELKLMCGYQFVTLEYVPDTKWTLNRDWGKCDVQVLGKESTTLRLVEF